MNFITNLAISIYITSTIFMLYIHFSSLPYLRKQGIRTIHPYFFIIIFVPIIHTIKCFKIMARAQKIAKRGM